MFELTLIFIGILCGLIIVNIFGAIDAYCNEMYKWMLGFIMWILILIAVISAFLIAFLE